MTGRGIIDDKGPAAASYFAMKELLDEGKVPENIRVRLILGTDEERTCSCIEYYAEHGEVPEFSITPDAMLSPFQRVQNTREWRSGQSSAKSAPTFVSRPSGRASPNDSKSASVNRLFRSFLYRAARAVNACSSFLKPLKVGDASQSIPLFSNRNCVSDGPVRTIFTAPVR